MLAGLLLLVKKSQEIGCVRVCARCSGTHGKSWSVSHSSSGAVVMHGANIVVRFFWIYDSYCSRAGSIYNNLHPMRPIVRARKTIIGHQRKHTRGATVLSCQSVRHPPTLRTPDTHMQSHKPRYEREKKNWSACVFAWAPTNTVANHPDNPSLTNGATYLPNSQKPTLAPCTPNNGQRPPVWHRRRYWC